MNTGSYITSDDILAIAAPMSGDRDFKAMPRGFYYSLIQKAFEELSLDSFFQEMRADLDMPNETLTLKLPEGCFNVRNIYIYSGDECNIESSRKVWHKRNYFTRGSGYIANDKGNNGNDPYYGSHLMSGKDKSLIRFDNNHGVNSQLFYNIQMGDLMLSSSCRGAGNKVHIHYNGTGCPIGGAPIIPVFFRSAIEDFVIESATRFRIANDTGDVRKWQALNNQYAKRLDYDGMDGSWHKAIQRIKTMNTAQRTDLSEYLSRGGWANGA